MFKPVNRHILIEKDKSDSTEQLIVLPEDYKPKMDKHAVFKVLNCADDVRFDLKDLPRIIVDQSMVEEISVDNTIYRVIQDNYVVGIIN